MTGNVFPIFFGVWILLAIVGFLLFYLNRNVAFKRRYLPWFLGLTGVLFIGFMLASGTPKFLVLIIAPVAALIMYMNVKGIQFCDACGRTLIEQMSFSRPEFCSKCGASLRKKSNPDGE